MSVRVETVADGRAKLYCGDCLEMLAAGAFEAADVVVTDPPYGIGYQRGAGGRGIHAAGNVACNDEAVAGDDAPFDPSPWLPWPCLLFGADHYCTRLPDTGTMHVWDKHCGRAGRDSFSDAELFWTSARQKRVVLRYLWKGLQQDGRGRRRHHPTEKPEQVMDWCIDMMPPGVVLDPYMGVGTTGVAAMRLGRCFIGAEIEPRYFDIACERIDAAGRQLRLDLAAPTPEQAALL